MNIIKKYTVIACAIVMLGGAIETSNFKMGHADQIKVATQYETRWNHQVVIAYKYLYNDRKNTILKCEGI